MIQIKVPAEGQITKWNVKLGDLVKKTKSMKDIDTDMK